MGRTVASQRNKTKIKVAKSRTSVSKSETVKKKQTRFKSLSGDNFNDDSRLSTILNFTRSRVQSEISNKILDKSCPNKRQREREEVLKSSRTRNSSRDDDESAKLESKTRTRFRILKEDTREVKFSQHEVQKWKPMSSATLEFLESLLVTAISTAKLENCGNLDPDVDLTMDRLRNQIMGKFKRMKVPANSFGDYRKVNHTKMELPDVRDKLEQQEHTLENAISVEEEHIAVMTEKEENQTGKERNRQTSLDLLLQNHTPKLDIPAWN